MHQQQYVDVKYILSVCFPESYRKLSAGSKNSIDIKVKEVQNTFFGVKKQLTRVTMPSWSR